MNNFKNNINLLMKISEVSRNQKLSSAEIKILQEKKLKKLLEHVLTHSKFYKNYYGERNITLDNINEITLEDLPIIDKKIVMENYDDLVCDKALKRRDAENFFNAPYNRFKKHMDKYTILHTSGSSGYVGISAFNIDEWNTMVALSIKRTSKAKLNLFRKVKNAYIGATDGSFAGMTLIMGTPKLFTEIMPLNINASVSELIERVNRFQPDIVTGYASGAYLLAEEQLKGHINIKPTEIICSGDMLTDFMRNEIKRAFGIEPTNVYGACEALGMAAECKSHNKFHLFNDYYNFEVLDKDLKPVLPGNSGNLVLTNLFNYTQPLIRYKMNDEITLDNTPCKCGSPFPVLKNISGRQEEFLWFKKADGTSDFIHPLILTAVHVEGILKFRFIQTSYTSLLMQAVVENNNHNSINEIYNTINEILIEKNLNKDVKFSVELVSELENDKRTGKFKLIVPLKDSEDLMNAPKIAVKEKIIL